MQVVKLENPTMAYPFVSQVETDGQVDNFVQLEADIKADGGTIEKVADDLVVIHLDGTSYTLALGFVLIVDGTGIGKVMSADMFNDSYTDISKVGVGDVAERLAQVEVGLADLGALASRVVALETALANKQTRSKSVGKPTE